MAMEKLVVTASNKESDGKALCNLDGEPITRELFIPGTLQEIEKVFGSLNKCVVAALKHRKVELENEIRTEYKKQGNGSKVATRKRDYFSGVQIK